jgi:hypothetical protein
VTRHVAGVGAVDPSLPEGPAEPSVHGRRAYATIARWTPGAGITSAGGASGGVVDAEFEVVQDQGRSHDLAYPGVGAPPPVAALPSSVTEPKVIVGGPLPLLQRGTMPYLPAKSA